MRHVAASLSALVLASLGVAAVPAFPPDEAIRSTLEERIEAGSGVGIVVGLIDAGGRRVVSAGRRDDGRALDGDTVFEIGSVTKVFTSLLLCDMVRRGEVERTDPVAKYLPPGVKVPQRGDRLITLEDLSSQLSGLPSMPSNLAPKDAANPFADYGPERLYAFLSGFTLTRDPGAQYEYSNLGAGLLGHALARRAGKGYEMLLSERVLGPLGMRDTAVTLRPELAGRLAAGHFVTLAPVGGTDFDVLAGAGALRSSANDLLTFLAANLGLADTPLSPAMKAMLVPRHATGIPDTAIALAWHVTTKDGREIVWHNGKIGGYSSFVGFDLEARAGVVVLENQLAETPDELGMKLLRGAPLALASGRRREIELGPGVLECYVGVYALAPGIAIRVTRNGGRLQARLTGQPPVPVYASAEREFFYRIVDAQLTFEVGDDGEATAVTLHQNGRDQRAPRVE